MAREKHKRRKPRGESTEAEYWGGPIRSMDEGSVMGLERRDRVRRSFGRNNRKQEDADTYDRQAVQYYKEASVRGLQSGQIQCGFGRCGWADDRAVRFRLAEQSLQALEPNELGKLLSTTGARRLHSQKDWGPADFRCAYRSSSFMPCLSAAPFPKLTAFVRTEVPGICLTRSKIAAWPE